MALLLAAAASAAAAPTDLGRLFFTPGQRAQLEAARAHSAAAAAPGRQGTDAAPTQRYDGVLIRSDGKTIRWFDGKPQLDGGAVSGLKPGQMRSGGKVYEPYQVLPAAPQTAHSTREPTP